MDYASLLKKGREDLKEADIRDADTDAYLLLSHISGKDRTFMYAHGDTEVPEHIMDMYMQMIGKRMAHIPLQHITGTQEFMGKEFIVNADVLIPRQDTELIVEEMMTVVQDGDSVLDMCTGSGCILLSLMSYKNNIRGTGADISADALRVAEANARRLAQDAVFIRSDMFGSIDGRFDYIVSNPPYIKSRDIEGLDEEVKTYEPRQALDGDTDGLKFYRILCEEAAGHLNKNGMLFMETGFDEGSEVCDMFRSAGYTDVKLKNDYSGNERAVICSIN